MGLETLDPTGELVGTLDCIFQDREGNVWAGANASLHRFSNSNVVRLPRLLRQLPESIPTPDLTLPWGPSAISPFGVAVPVAARWHALGGAKRERR